MNGEHTKPVEVRTEEEQFNKDIPPVLTDGGDPIGQIEDNPDYPDEAGKIWLRGTWIDVVKARELRDWLNKVIP